MWLAVAALGAGTIAGFSMYKPGLYLLLSLAGLALIAARRRSLLALVALSLAIFGAGGLNASLRAGRPAALVALAANVARCDVAGRVIESAGGLGTLLDVDRVTCAGYPPIDDGGVIVVDGTVGDAGGRARASGWLLPLGDDSFDRSRARLGADAYLDVVEVESQPPGSGPFAAAAAIRGGLRQATAALDARRAGLLQGLAVGDTSGLDQVTMERFRNAGLSHLLAVSGSNVAIVLAAVGSLVSGLGHHIRLALALAGLVLFVVVVGPDPSVLRAAIMAAVALGALESGRETRPLQALGIALLVLLAARPGLVFSVGLHLSAVATAGLVVGTGAIQRRVSFLPSLVAVPLAATVAAQLAVAPIVIATFGRLSITGPVANLVAVPAVAPATVLGLLAAVLGAVAPPLGSLCARLAEPFAGWIVEAGDAFGTSSWTAPVIPRAVAVPIAVLLALLLVRRTRPRGALESAYGVLVEAPRSRGQ